MQKSRRKRKIFTLAAKLCRTFELLKKIKFKPNRIFQSDFHEFQFFFCAISIKSGLSSKINLYFYRTDFNFPWKVVISNQITQRYPNNNKKSANQTFKSISVSVIDPWPQYFSLLNFMYLFCLQIIIKNLRSIWGRKIPKYSENMLTM
jgi:hypothetical protein